MAKSSSIRSLLLAAALLVAAAAGVAPHGAEAGASSSSGGAVMGLVTGVVPCSAGSSINAAFVPGFPNAAVQLECGGRAVAGATADGSGAFAINMGKLTAATLMPLLNDKCRVVVTTPLAACDASLAGVTGTLAAPVQLLGDSGGALGGLGGLIGGIAGVIGQIVSGVLGNIISIVPSAFSLV
uniref:Phylloplanin n=1 Tax=Oryza punctata TaxID=4537 RepID=A0A0E0KDJ7_ORYPU